MNMLLNIPKTDIYKSQILQLVHLFIVFICILTILILGWEEGYRVGGYNEETED